MKSSLQVIQKTISESILVKEKLCQSDFLVKISQIARLISKSLKKGNKLMICGNGGSAADAQHTAAELVNRFKMDRQPLAAIALTTDSSILTSIANDYDYHQIFKKQVEALGKRGDVLLALSTSGKSRNVLEAIEAAKRIGIVTIGLTGKGPNPLSQKSNLCIEVPSSEVARIQESHLLIIHIICDLVEQQCAKKSSHA